MKLKVENDRLVVYHNVYYVNEALAEIDYEEVLANIDIKELARLLKPYIDSIPNCECGKK